IINGEVKWDICKTPRLMRSLMRLALLNIAFTPSARKETATESQTSCRLPNKFLLTNVREMTTRAIFLASCFALIRQAVSLFEIFNGERLDVCARGGGGGGGFPLFFFFFSKVRKKKHHHPFFPLFFFLL